MSNKTIDGTVIIFNSGNIKIGHKELLTAEKRKEIYTTALAMYYDMSARGRDFAGICFTLHLAGAELKYWERLTKPSIVIHPKYPIEIEDIWHIGYNKEFIEIVEAANLNNAQMNSDTLGGYWWPLSNREIRITVLRDAIRLADERIKNDKVFQR